MALNEGLSKEQEAFVKMLEKAPFLRHLWDMKRRRYSPELVEEFLGYAALGETIMARFYLCVWLNNNKFEFDIFQAIGHLDAGNMQIVRDWIADPFWP